MGQLVSSLYESITLACMDRIRPGSATAHIAHAESKPSRVTSRRESFNVEHAASDIRKSSPAGSFKTPVMNLPPVALINSLALK
jgi:hypothetical protein